jgi:hypothetical protein
VNKPSAEPSAKEFRRKRRVLDQTITGHAFLRDVYERRALVLTLLVLALSTVATATAFLAGDTPVTIAGIRARTQIWVGVLTTVIFFLSLVDLRVDWRQRAGAHAEAVRRLARVKGVFRGVTIVEDRVETTGADLDFEYESAMEQVPPIPEKWFLRAKARHLRKVAASQLLSSHPGAPSWLMKARVTWDGIRGKSSPAD